MLDLTADEEFNLKGIEKLYNLEKLSVTSLSYQDATNRIVQELDEIKEYENTPEYYEKYAEVIKNTQHIENAGQIKDIACLYQCKNLQTLDIPNQRQITDIDFSNLPNIQFVNMQGCENLKSITGLSEVKVLKEHIKTDGKNKPLDCQFDFRGCYNLIDIKDMYKVARVLETQQITNKDCEFFLPTTTYCHINNIYPEALDRISERIREDEANDIFLWNENIDRLYSSVDINTLQMQVLQKKVSEIVNYSTSNLTDNSDLSKISGVYRYVCNNLVYDKIKLVREKKVFGKDIGDVIRNSYVSIIKGKGVCVGISNAFNLMLAEMGIVAEPCLCKIEGYNQDKLERLTFSDHQITSIKLKDENNNVYTYYFDPTWDLGKKKYHYFALSKNEMKRFNHMFTLKESYVPNAPSIKDEVEESNYSCYSLDKSKVKTRLKRNIKQSINTNIAKVEGALIERGRDIKDIYDSINEKGSTLVMNVAKRTKELVSNFRNKEK